MSIDPKDISNFSEDFLFQKELLIGMGDEQFSVRERFVQNETNYATKEYVTDAIKDITVTPGGGSGDGDHNISITWKEVPWDDVTEKPQAFPPAAHRHNATEIDGLTTGGGSAAFVLGEIVSVNGSDCTVKAYDNARKPTGDEIVAPSLLESPAIGDTAIVFVQEGQNYCVILKRKSDDPGSSDPGESEPVGATPQIIIFSASETLESDGAVLAASMRSFGAGGALLRQSIDWGDGTEESEDNAPSETEATRFTHTYTTPGTYTLTATATNTNGQTTTKTIVKEVTGGGLISLDVVQDGLNVTLKWGLKEPVDLVTISWGDGSTVSQINTYNPGGETITSAWHRYTNSGSYTIRFGFGINEFKNVTVLVSSDPGSSDDGGSSDPGTVSDDADTFAMPISVTSQSYD